MLDALLSVAVTVLILTFGTSYVILRKVVPDASFRRLLILLVLITPPIAVFSILKAFFIRPEPLRYRAELGRIEDAIETERVRTFDTKPLRPSFSHIWKMSYLRAVEKSAKAASKLAPPLNTSAYGRISNLS